MAKYLKNLHLLCLSLFAVQGPNTFATNLFKRPKNSFQDPFQTEGKWKTSYVFFYIKLSSTLRYTFLKCEEKMRVCLTFSDCTFVFLFKKYWSIS